jgi:ComF family protein
VSSSPTFGTIFFKIIDFLIPPRCICTQIISHDELLCHDCFVKLDPVIYFCKSCGVPYTMAIEDICELCFTSASNSQKLCGRSALFYNDFSKEWIMRLKYGDQTQMAKKMAYWMVRCDPDFFKDIDYIVPVPIHFWRLLKRRYNQSALIANHISRFWKKPVLHSALYKTKPTPSQGEKTRKERHDNIKSSFAVKNKQHLAGKHILLVDDVLTTGATLSECNRVLYEAGAASVKYLTFAYRAEGIATK